MQHSIDDERFSFFAGSFCFGHRGTKVEGQAPTSLEVLSNPYSTSNYIGLGLLSMQRRRRNHP